MASRLRCVRTYREGDTKPSIGLKLADDDGAVDLTSWSFKLLLSRNPYGTDVIEIAGVIGNPLLGEVTFPWSAGDLICGRGQKAYIEATDPAGEICSLDTFCIDVLDKFEDLP